MRRLALLAVIFAAIAVLQSEPGHLQAASKDRVVIVIAGLTSTGDSAEELKGKVSGFLKSAAPKLSLQDDDFLVASYDTYATAGDYREPQYSHAHTCVGTKKVRDNLSAIVNDPKYAGAEFDIIGHSLGGFVAALWASEQDENTLSRVHSVITVDSPFSLSEIALDYLLDNGFFSLGGLHFDCDQQSPPPGYTSNDLNATYADLKRDSFHRAISNNAANGVPLVVINCNDGDCVGGAPARNVGKIATDIPGSWRYYTVGGETSHGGILDTDAFKSEVAKAVSTDVIDNRDIDCGSKWKPKGGDQYIRGNACETDEKNPQSFAVAFEGEGVSVIYSGWAEAKISVDGGSEQPLPSQNKCSRYEYEHDLCRYAWFGDLQPGSHTLTLTTIPDCFPGRGCYSFFFDALEVTPSAASSGGGCASGDAADIVLIIDGSGSMSENDPGNLRLQAAKLFLNTMRQGDSMSVIDFSETPTAVQPLTLLDASTKPAAEAAIDPIVPKSGTDIGGAIELAAQILEGGSSPKKAAVLLTDGLQTSGPYMDQHLRFRDKGWPIYAIGLSTSADADLLNRIAQDTGTGKYIFLKDASTIQPTYAQISVQANCGQTSHQAVTPLQQGETKQLAVAVPDNQQLANFVASWPGSVVDLSLTDPGGRVIDANISDPNIVHAKALTFEVYQITDPAPGDWQMQLFGRDLPVPEDVTTQLGVIPKAQPAATTLAAENGHGMSYVVPAIALAVLVVVLLGGLSLVRFGAGAATAGVILPDGRWFGISPRARFLEIGRAPGNDIMLDDEYVSRRHLRIEHSGNAYRAEDVGSSSGTRVNGESLSSAVLEDGDTIEIGKTHLTFRLKKPRSGR
jgi:hypothetical protein